MKLILFLLGLSSVTAFAAGDSRNEAGIGFTDNANLSAENRKSDFFWKAMTSEHWSAGIHKPEFRLSFRDFFKENANDVLAWRLGDRLPLNIQDWNLGFGVFG